MVGGLEKCFQNVSPLIISIKEDDGLECKYMLISESFMLQRVVVTENNIY